jgi:hypothetical protein
LWQLVNRMLDFYPSEERTRILDARRRPRRRGKPEMSQTRFAALWSELDDLLLVFTLDVVHWDTLGNAGLKQRIVDEGIELVLRQASEALTGVGTARGTMSAGAREVAGSARRQRAL